MLNNPIQNQRGNPMEYITSSICVPMQEYDEDGYLGEENVNRYAGWLLFCCGWRQPNLASQAELYLPGYSLLKIRSRRQEKTHRYL